MEKHFHLLQLPLELQKHALGHTSMEANLIIINGAYSQVNEVTIRVSAGSNWYRTPGGKTRKRNVKQTEAQK